MTEQIVHYGHLHGRCAECLATWAFASYDPEAVTCPTCKSIMANDVERRLDTPRSLNPCRECNGSGVNPENVRTWCQNCHGTGKAS